MCRSRNLLSQTEGKLLKVPRVEVEERGDRIRFEIRAIRRAMLTGLLSLGWFDVSLTFSEREVAGEKLPSSRTLRAVPVFEFRGT